jgi:hypothetical protein
MLLMFTSLSFSLDGVDGMEGVEGEGPDGNDCTDGTERTMDDMVRLKRVGSACNMHPNNGDTSSLHSVALMCCIALTNYTVGHASERQSCDAAS